MNNITPLPWKLLDDKKDHETPTIVGDNKPVAITVWPMGMSKETELANAAYIVQAVNQHERLVSDLTTARELINRAVELMTPEQLSQWDGVRAWLETAGEGGSK